MISNIGQRKDIANRRSKISGLMTRKRPESQRIIQVIPSYVDATENQTLQIGKASKWIEPPPFATIMQSADGEYMRLETSFRTPMLKIKPV